MRFPEKFRRSFVWNRFFREIVEFIFASPQVFPNRRIARSHPPLYFLAKFDTANVLKHRNLPLGQHLGIRRVRFDSINNIPLRYRYSIRRCRPILSRLRSNCFRSMRCLLGSENAHRDNQNYHIRHRNNPATISILHLFTISAVNPSLNIPIIFWGCSICTIPPSFFAVLALRRNPPIAIICIWYPHLVLFPFNAFRNCLSIVRRYDGDPRGIPGPLILFPDVWGIYGHGLSRNFALKLICSYDVTGHKGFYLLTIF